MTRAATSECWEALHPCARVPERAVMLRRFCPPLFHRSTRRNSLNTIIMTLCLASAAGAPAYADPVYRVFGPGRAVTVEDDPTTKEIDLERIELDEPHMLTPRVAWENCFKVKAGKMECQQQLAECNARKLPLPEEKPTTSATMTFLKTSAIVGAVIGAFALGMAID
jgi:hypothetical protein